MAYFQCSGSPGAERTSRCKCVPAPVACFMPRGQNHSFYTWLYKLTCSLTPWGFSFCLWVVLVAWSGSEPGYNWHDNTGLFTAHIFTPAISAQGKLQANMQHAQLGLHIWESAHFLPKSIPWGGGSGVAGGWLQRDCQIFVFWFRYNPNRCKIGRTAWLHPNFNFHKTFFQ